MFYGFGVSPYVSMMRRYGQQYPGQAPGIIDDPEEEEKKRSPWRDLFLPKQHAGEEVPMDVAQKTRARGLGALGMSLLEGAASNDYSGSIARGMAGMRESMDSDLEQNRRMGMERTEEQRRAAAEARATAQEADRSRLAPVQLEAAQTGLEAGKLELDTYRERQQQGRDLRAKTGKNAEQMVAEINALAAANPDDEKLQAMAKRATGYSLGDDSDLNSLAKLHDDMTSQAFRDEDVKWKTEAEITAEKERAAAGYGEIPASRRAEESLDLDRLRTSYYGRQTDKQFDRDPNVKPATWYDDVNKEIDALIKPTLEARMKHVGESDTGAMMKPGYDFKKNGLIQIQPPTQEELTRLRQGVERTAIENVNRRYGLYSDEGNGAGRVEPRENEAPQANHARNQAVGGLLQGGSEAEALAILRRLGPMNGFTAEQILENAKIMARRKGWDG
jgi:hypothetical protein